MPVSYYKILDYEIMLIFIVSIIYDATTKNHITKDHLYNLGGIKMKKVLALVALTLVSVFLLACTNIQTSEETYAFKGDSNVSVDDRKFVLEDIPKNIAEETVIRYFLYTINADFDAESVILSDIEPHKISTENKKKQFKDNIYTQSYVIHKISTLTESEYSERELDNGEHNPLYYYGWKERIKEYKLTEYKIVNVNFTQTLSKKAIEQGPQWGNGTYNRSFIVGKTADDNSYKIYDFGMM